MLPTKRITIVAFYDDTLKNASRVESKTAGKSDELKLIENQLDAGPSAFEVTARFGEAPGYPGMVLST